MNEPDLTILYLTCNRLPERWMRFQLQHLRKAAGDLPIISLSMQPMDLGWNLLQDLPASAWNVYAQMLRGARQAETPFVAVAEDDTLYTYEHFHAFRPPMDAVAYNMAKWSIFAWDPTMFSLRRRLVNYALIAPTDLLIEALTERTEKWPRGHQYTGEVGRAKVERALRVTVRPHVEWWCHNPIVNLCHGDGLNPRVSRHPRHGTRLVKHHAELKAVEIPYWGKAADIVKEYTG